jgi:hypothetical protein
MKMWQRTCYSFMIWASSRRKFCIKHSETHCLSNIHYWNLSPIHIITTYLVVTCNRLTNFLCLQNFPIQFSVFFLLVCMLHALFKLPFWLGYHIITRCIMTIFCCLLRDLFYHLFRSYGKNFPVSTHFDVFLVHWRVLCHTTHAFLLSVDVSAGTLHL